MRLLIALGVASIPAGWITVEILMAGSQEGAPLYRRAYVAAIGFVIVFAVALLVAWWVTGFFNWEIDSPTPGGTNTP